MVFIKSVRMYEVMSGDVRPHAVITSWQVPASSAGPSLGTVQCNCKLYRSVAVISLPGNAWCMHMRLRDTSLELW